MAKCVHQIQYGCQFSWHINSMPTIHLNSWKILMAHSIRVRNRERMRWKMRPNVTLQAAALCTYLRCSNGNCISLLDTHQSMRDVFAFFYHAASTYLEQKRVENVIRLFLLFVQVDGILLSLLRIFWARLFANAHLHILKSQVLSC